MIAATCSPLVMVEETDPHQLAKINAQRQRFRKNADWLQAHLADIYAKHRGKFICVAAQELFVGATAPAVLGEARARHPEDDGLLLRYIPREKLERVYAHSGALDAV